jgi:hypothetical protein
MSAVFWSSFANFKTGIAFIYSMADSTSASTQVVVWKVVGKTYWRILCGQVCTKFMNCNSAKSVHSFTVSLAEKFILLVQIFGGHGDQIETPAYAHGLDLVQIFFSHILSPFFLLTESYGLWELSVHAVTCPYHLSLVLILY